MKTKNDLLMQKVNLTMYSLKTVLGLKNKYTVVNNVELYYVEGGSGMPLLCLPWWPQTWYSLNTIAPTHANQYKVLEVFRVLFPPVSKSTLCKKRVNGKLANPVY